MKTLIYLSCFVALTIAMPYNSDLEGAPKKLEGKELEEAVNYLNKTLTQLAAQGGPNYQVTEVICATSQIVSGILYSYDVEMKKDNSDAKKCHVEIWSQPWLVNGTEISIKCEGEQDLVQST